MIKVIDIQHPLAGALIYWAAALAIGVPMLIFTVYSTSYMVEVNGQVAGVVEDKEDFTRLVSEVERTAAQILEEEDYRFEGEITYTRALSQPEDFTSRQEIKNFLMGQIGEVMMRYLLTVEGEVVGVAQSQEELEALLDEVTAPYVTENRRPVSVSLSRMWRSPMTMSRWMWSRIWRSPGRPCCPTARGNPPIPWSPAIDTGIAYAHNMSLSELLSLNPQASVDSLMPGDVLVVKKAIPFLSVQTTEEVTYTEAIECPVEEVAAYTAVDRAEDEPGPAAEINTQAVANLAKAAQKEDCLLIHISTDYVFDGTATTPYTEKIKTCPVSVYGKTKLAGEEAIIRSGCFYIIIRTAWLYSAFGHNFVKTILRLAEERPEINVVNDQIGTPTYAEDLAKAIVKIMANDDRVEHEGIYHYSNAGVCSWYDFAVEIVRLSGLNCRVNPVTTAEYPTKTHRPAYSVLDKTKIKHTFGVEVPEWQEALRRMMGEISGEQRKEKI